MGLITENTPIKWNPANKKWYENKGYIYTKMGDEFEVKVEDLSVGSNSLVDIQCDGCGGVLKNIKWHTYLRCVHKNGKYFCLSCANNLFGREKGRKTKLKNSRSFYDWCYDNLSKEEADIIIARWDYDKNIDRNGYKLTPQDISYSSGGLNQKGFWFKCLNHYEHESELKYISGFTHGQKGSLDCNKCNTLAVTHPHLIPYLVNIDDAYKYSFGSTIKIPMKCQNCGCGKLISPNTLLIQGFSCNKCSDNISYPQKFIFNVLKQLNIEFKSELSRTTFEWCSKYKYDFYISQVNGIIETHGQQHYEQTSGKWGSLDEIQENDKDKEELAKANNIDHYIIIDCRKSELEWIKNNIMNRDSNRPNQPCLAEVLNFKEEDINWLECHEWACSSLVKEVCNMWNGGIGSIQNIKNKLKISISSINRYLKQGVRLGWCNYDPEEENEKNIIKTKQRQSKKVVCTTTGKVFYSITQASTYYKIDESSISKVCRKKQKSAGKHPITKKPLEWMYYDEYIKSNPIPHTYNDQEIKLS